MGKKIKYSYFVKKNRVSLRAFIFIISVKRSLTHAMYVKALSPPHLVRDDRNSSTLNSRKCKFKRAEKPAPFDVLIRAGGGELSAGRRRGRAAPELVAIPSHAFPLQLHKRGILNIFMCAYKSRLRKILYCSVLKAFL